MSVAEPHGTTLETGGSSMWERAVAVAGRVIVASGEDHKSIVLSAKDRREKSRDPTLQARDDLPQRGGLRVVRKEHEIPRVPLREPRTHVVRRADRRTRGAVQRFWPVSERAERLAIGIQEHHRVEP